MSNTKQLLESIQNNLNEAEEDINIKEIGTPGCAYTGGGVWVAYIPVEIDGNSYMITLDSESEQIDEVEGGEFSVCDSGDWNLVTQYGDDGVFIFSSSSKYMPLYNKLKSVLSQAVKDDEEVESNSLTEGRVYDVFTKEEGNDSFVKVGSYPTARCATEVQNFYKNKPGITDIKVSEKDIDDSAKIVDPSIIGESVEVNTYGETKVFDTRAEAINFFEEAVVNSEGAEQERYINILQELKNTNKNSISDTINEDDEEYEEESIYDMAENYDGNLATDMLEDSDWDEVLQNAPETYKNALRARENFVSTNWEWSTIPDIVWNEIDTCVDDGSGFACGNNPASVVDNIIVNGDYGDFDNYKNEDESDEDFISRVEDEVYGIYPEERFVIYSL